MSRQRKKGVNLENYFTICGINRCMKLITGENDSGRRLDRVLRKALPDHPLALIHRLLRRRQVFVNGKPAAAQDRLEAGVTISIPSIGESQQPVNAPPSSPLPDIIWERAGLLAVNKPAGLAVHGHGSLDTMVQSYFKGKLPASLSFRPGPLHRLDKPSSGIVVFSASLEGAQLFTSLLRERKVKKTYLAIVEGNAQKEETWEDELVRDREKKKTFVEKSDRPPNAVTKIMPIASRNGFSFIHVEIATGRTHQIRAQAAAHGFPLAGDVKYNAKNRNISLGEQRIKSKEHHTEFFLHAYRLEFLEYSIEAPPPDAFRKKIEEIFGDISCQTEGKFT